MRLHPAGVADGVNHECNPIRDRHAWQLDQRVAKP
jgi:hypothetical protein